MSLTGAISKAIVKSRRKALANKIFDEFDGVVQRGHFKDLRLQGDSNVSRGPLALKIFGLYEHQVVEEIASSGPFSDLINLGAADGYMSLGPRFAGLCKRSICFEMTEKGREAVKFNAEVNGVSDSTIIRGIADETLMDQLSELEVDFSSAVVLCDIEGAEFSVLSSDILEAAKQSKFVIELHDRLMEGGLSLRQSLINRIPEDCTHRIITAESVPYVGVEYLERMHDLDRSLVLSEGRKVIGEWLVIEPKKRQ